MKKIAFIVNPIAGGRNKEQLMRCVPRIFSSNEDFFTEIYYTRCGGDAKNAADDFIKRGFTHIIAVGGDGTVSQCACSMLGGDAMLGIVPCGSGNGLARHLGLPLNPVQALHHIKRAQVCCIDACEINGIHFFCTAGIGFDAVVGAKFANSKRRGFLGYLKVIVSELKTYKSQPYCIVVDGKKIQRNAFLITFANAGQWGNNGWIAPQANISDGLIDVVIINDFRMLRLPIMLYKLLSKRMHEVQQAEIIPCSAISVERSNDGDVHIDGEAHIMGKHIEIKIRKHALKVLK